MTKIVYEYMGQQQEQEFLTNDKTKASNQLILEYAHNTQDLKVILITNDEDDEEQRIYNELDNRRQNEMEDIKKLILKTVKAQYKKPYGKSNNKLIKEISFKNINKTEIENFINTIAEKINEQWIYNDSITINIGYSIFIEPIEEYYLKAE